MSRPALFLAILLAPAAAWAEPAVDALSLGAPAAGVERVLGEVEWLDTDAPQALARGMIDTGLLQAINSASAAPTTKDGRFDFSPFDRIGIAERPDRTYVVVLSSKGLRFAYVVRRVPVDPTKDPRVGWSRARLRRLENALAELSPYRLRPVLRDRYGNTFAWRGEKGAARLAVRYLPGEDALTVLMY